MLSYCVQSSKLKHKVLVDLCALSARVFSKERDKHQLCRQLVFELIQALKFKTTIPNHNVLLLAVIVLQDAGGHLPAGMPTGIDTTDSCTPTLHTSNASDCMRQYIGDILEFVGDIHCLSRIKVQQKKDAAKPGFEEDTLGAQLKGAIAQYLALEMTRGNSKDPKSVARYLPWLYNVPSSLQQQGFKEYTECVGHMRLLSWLLLGTLTHAALVTHRGDRIGQRGVATNYNKAHSHGHSVAQPIPQETSCHIAEHIQVIFTGFADQWKSSVQLMSSLFNAFTLCLLWTVYLEQLALTTPATSEQHNVTMGILFEFWAKITPSILQLAAFSQSVSVANDYKREKTREKHLTKSVISVTVRRNGEPPFHQPAGGPEGDTIDGFGEAAAALESDSVMQYTAVRHVAHAPAELSRLHDDRGEQQRRTGPSGRREAAQVAGPLAAEDGPD